MTDSAAYMMYRNYNGTLGIIKLFFDSGYVFLKVYRILSFLNDYVLLRPVVKILAWFYFRIYSCEISMSSKIIGPVIFPHPIGIVIGDGVVLEGVNVIYQNVTIGQNRELYPNLKNCTIYPNSVIAGKASFENETFGALSRSIH